MVQIMPRGQQGKGERGASRDFLSLSWPNEHNPEGHNVSSTLEPTPGQDYSRSRRHSLQRG